MFEQFFKNYATAFVEKQSSVISASYQFPMTFYTEQGEAVPFTQQAFDNNSGQLFALYDRLGVKQVDFDIVSTQELSENLTLVSVNWQFLREDASLVYEATTRYLINVNNAPKIIAVFVVDESSKIAQLTS